MPRKTAVKKAQPRGTVPPPKDPRHEPDCTSDPRDACCVTINQPTCGCNQEPRYCCPPPAETCTFAVYMTRMRVTKNKELASKAELMVTGYVDGVSAAFPGNGLWVQLHEKWGWRIINKLVTNVTIARGTTRVLWVYADAIEADTIAAGSWEMGSSDPVLLKITCGEQTGANYVSVDCKHVKDVNAGKGSAGVEIEFMAFQVTP